MTFDGWAWGIRGCREGGIEMSDTPRTDAAVHPTKLLRRADGTFAEAVDAVTCRQLERELSARCDELERVKDEIGAIRARYTNYE